MKRFLIIIIYVGIHTCLVGQSKNILSGKYSAEDLQQILITYDNWVPFPKIQDRLSWEKADRRLLQNYIKQGEAFLDYDWPALPATSSLLIVRTGNRSEYEDISFKKRKVLGTLLLAEIAENKGRFVDQIINGVWSICEESWWGAPAHLPKTKEYSGLMDVSQPFVDLFAAETGTFLAWVDYFLGDKLDSVSPQIRKRIYNEVNFRLMQPLMDSHYSWMDVDDIGRAPNNWNPWICSNWINFVLLLEKDQQTRAAMVAKILKVLDGFVNPYPEDGGCDEGPSYWDAAAASLYDNIVLLNLASNNSFRYVFDDIKIKNMGKYIYRVQISENYFLNFADADPQPRIAGNLAYRYGKDIYDEKMMRFGAYYSTQKDDEIRPFYYFRNLFDIFIQQEIQNTSPKLPYPGDVWFPSLQVMIARDTEGTSDGFFLAAKGGHNNESHNHNDIGNFIIYYNGHPLIIDVGRGTYTARTFNEQRYEIWNNCSDYHNLPTINGHNQLPGVDYRATNVEYDKEDSSAIFKLDIAKAYGSEADIISWEREVKLNRGKNIRITDNTKLGSVKSINQHIMTCYPADVINDRGQIIIHFFNDSIAQDFVIEYNPKQMRASVEKIKFETPEDVGIKEKWGDTLHRINFEIKTPKKKDSYNFTIKLKE
ncbi:MAG: heparinase II/III family protein [Dysgonomonas sp.]